jgi:hypothetical protein
VFYVCNSVCSTRTVRDTCALAGTPNAKTIRLHTSGVTCRCLNSETLYTHSVPKGAELCGVFRTDGHPIGQVEETTARVLYSSGSSGIKNGF